MTSSWKDGDDRSDQCLRDAVCLEYDVGEGGLGETNNRMKGTNSAVVNHNSRAFIFGSKGSSKLERCKTMNTSEDRPSREPASLSFRILRAYSRKRANSGVLGSLLKYFRTTRLREETAYVIGELTVHLPSFQTSPGKVFTNGLSRCWVSHSASNTRSSKLWQQHAKATAAVRPRDATSSRAISLTISSTWRQAYVRSGRCV